VKPPIACVYGNCVFADGLDDCWAAFAVRVASYRWLSEDGKRARLLELLGAIEAIEADLQIVRVARRWELGRYVRELQAGAGSRAHARTNGVYLEEHDRRLRDIGTARATVYLLVSLRDPERDVASYVSQAAESGPREWWRELRRAFSPHDRRLLKVSDLERARVRADQAHARLADYLPVRQARGVELQWLIRRAFCRGLGEPQIDGLHEPRALVFERNGQAQLAPLEGDVLRWGSLVPFPWFFLLALECAFWPLDSSLRTALSGAKCPCLWPQNPQNTRLRGSLKKPSARHPSRPILVVQGGAR
jgi:hypothetical protein